ncbi:MAG: hypothetical protein VKI42_07420 [Synechococcaceae cyanobacterium]|nr:hypothetical protein [Synechococcaceae cyanobacterium]
MNGDEAQAETAWSHSLAVTTSRKSMFRLHMQLRLSICRGYPQAFPSPATLQPMPSGDLWKKPAVFGENDRNMGKSWIHQQG